MADTSYEFAIFGSTPLSGLVAGLLATVHQKKVCIVGDVPSAFRLTRGIDLSVMPATRPETWAMLKEGTAETLKLLAHLGGKAGIHRIDPLVAAETSAGHDALAHMRHVALGFGYAVERAPGGVGIENGIAYRLRDAVCIERQTLQPVIEQWLAAGGVGRVSSRAAKVMLKRDGSAKIESGAISIEATKAVLCDSASILAHLEIDERDGMLISQSMTTILTEPARPLAAPVIVYSDRGVTLCQGSSGNIVALSLGRPELATTRVGGCLGSQGHLRAAGQSSFRSVLTADGAPLVGQAKGLKAAVVAGLGIGGAFLAPAIARFLAGKASDREQRYFSARDAGRGSARSIVAEYQSTVAFEAQL